MDLLPPNPTDAALLALLAERREAALDTLMKRYWEGLYRKCWSFLRDEDAAKDCVQEIFIALWQHSTPETIHNLDHYLHQAARFRALTSIRSSKRKELVEQRGMRLTNLLLNGDGLDALMLKELKEKLERVISGFPEQQQQVWRLNREEGMTYPEIAKLLGISSKTVEKKMSASLKILRNEMGGQVGEAMILMVLFHLY